MFAVSKNQLYTKIERDATNAYRQYNLTKNFEYLRSWDDCQAKLSYLDNMSYAEFRATMHTDLQFATCVAEIMCDYPMDVLPYIPTVNPIPEVVQLALL